MNASSLAAYCILMYASLSCTANSNLANPAKSTFPYIRPGPRALTVVQTCSDMLIHSHPMGARTAQLAHYRATYGAQSQQYPLDREGAFNVLSLLPAVSSIPLLLCFLPFLTSVWKPSLIAQSESPIEFRLICALHAFPKLRSCKCRIVAWWLHA